MRRTSRAPGVNRAAQCEFISRPRVPSSNKPGVGKLKAQTSSNWPSWSNCPELEDRRLRMTVDASCERSTEEQPSTLAQEGLNSTTTIVLEQRRIILEKWEGRCIAVLASWIVDRG